MESKTSTKRIKFSRLCLTQGRAANDGQPVKTAVQQSSQISKFFNRPLSTDDNYAPSTSSANQMSVEDEKPENVDSAATSSNSRQSDDTSNSDANTKEPNTTEIPHKIERVKTKRLFDVNKQITDTKKTIKNFFAADHNESLTDFEIPKKVARKSSTTTTKKPKTTRSRSKKQPDIRKILKKQNDGVALNEEEEIQLTMEISKIESNETDGSNLQTNFDQFEYKPKNGTNDVASIFGVPKKSKVKNKWKSKCTPLTRRDDEVQRLRKFERIDELLMDNILILSRKRRASNGSNVDADFVYDISSKLLQRFCMTEKILFELNDNDVQSERCIQQYYTNNLVEPSTVAIGSLLRDWSKIPGRDSVFDGIPTTQEATSNEHREIEIELSNEPDRSFQDCVDRISLNPVVDAEISSESQNTVVSQMEVEEAIASHGTDDTIILDTNDIEAELNLINSRIRLSENFAEMQSGPSEICDSKLMRSEFIRGPSPDLFDDDDYDDGSEFEKDSLACSNKQDNDVIVVEDSPVEINCDASNKLNNEIIVNETVMSPAYSLHLSDNDGSLIEISDESSHSTLTGRQHKADAIEYTTNTVKNTPVAATASSSLRNTLSFTERLELMDRDVVNEFKSDIAADVFGSNELQSSHQLSQDSIELSDNEPNYSKNSAEKSPIDTQALQLSPMAAENEIMNFNDDDDFNFDYGCNAAVMTTDLDLVNQSVCEMLEKTFEYRDSGHEMNRDESKTPKSNAKVWKKTHSERVLGTKRNHSPISFTRNVSKPNCHLASSVSTRTIITADLSTDDYIIRYGTLSPMPDYDSMEMSDLQQELRKYGLKQSLKKRQAIICLEYIYNRTHPYIDSDATDDAAKSNKSPNEKLNADSASAEPNLNFNIGFSRDHLVDEKFQKLEVERVFLPSWPRSKRPWCLQPLHIAWHNLVKANTELFRMVLASKPIELRALKNYFKTIEMTFANKDLIAFLDTHSVPFRK